MSFFGRLFAAPAAIEKTVDAVIKTGDALFYTEEEKAQAGMRRLEWILKYHEASKGSNVARRLVALMFTAVFLLLLLAVAGLIVVGALTTEPVAAGEPLPPSIWFTASRQLFQLISDTLVVPITVIIGFYFSSGMVRDWGSKDK